MNPSSSLTSRWLPGETEASILEAPRHMFLFYKESNFLLDSLSRFAGDALRCGNRAVVIGMGAHLDILAERLKRQQFNVGNLIRGENYVQIDAQETLSEILLYGMPDERCFREVIEKRVICRRRGAAEAPPPAIIDEMAGLLWLDGKAEAAMRLMTLWQRLGETHAFSLCCVYPIASPVKADRPERLQVRAVAAGA